MGLFSRFKRKKSEKEKPVKSGQIEVEAKEKPTPLPEVAPGARLEANKNKETKKPAKSAKKLDTKDAYRVLVKPLLTEKSSALGMNNQYVFAVARRANKIEIKKAIRSLYGVEPIAVNIMSRKGKYTRYGRTEGYTKNWKKAIVTLREGDKIEIYEGV